MTDCLFAGVVQYQSRTSTVLVGGLDVVSAIHSEFGLDKRLIVIIKTADLRCPVSTFLVADLALADLLLRFEGQEIMVRVSDAALDESAALRDYTSI